MKTLYDTTFLLFRGEKKLLIHLFQPCKANPEPFSSFQLFVQICRKLPECFFLRDMYGSTHVTQHFNRV